MKGLYCGEAWGEKGERFSKQAVGVEGLTNIESYLPCEKYSSSSTSCLSKLDVADDVDGGAFGPLRAEDFLVTFNFPLNERGV
jgi:hypothetical protein